MACRHSSRNGSVRVALYLRVSTGRQDLYWMSRAFLAHEEDWPRWVQSEETSLSR